MTMESHAAAGRIVAEVDMPARRQPKELLIRFRHPEQRRIQSATVNGAAWTDFDRGQGVDSHSGPGSEALHGDGAVLNWTRGHSSPLPLGEGSGMRAPRRRAIAVMWLAP